MPGWHRIRCPDVHAAVARMRADWAPRKLYPLPNTQNSWVGSIGSTPDFYAEGLAKMIEQTLDNKGTQKKRLLFPLQHILARILMRFKPSLSRRV